MHELIAVLIPEQEGARRGEDVDQELADGELGRLAGLHYDAWGPADPWGWSGDFAVPPLPARAEVALRRGTSGFKAYPVYYAEDMFELGYHLGGVIGPDGRHHRDWKHPSNGASAEDYELFRTHRDCLVVLCDVHF